MNEAKLRDFWLPVLCLLILFLLTAHLESRWLHSESTRQVLEKKLPSRSGSSSNDAPLRQP